MGTPDETLIAALAGLAATPADRTAARVALARLQWRAAAAGNATMLMWLGKQILGQRGDHDERTDDLDGPVVTLEMIRAVLQAEPEDGGRQ
jgi:hypothetical protein